MSNEPSEEELSTAAMPIMIYAGLSGAISIVLLIMAGVFWFQDELEGYITVIYLLPLLPTLVLSLLAWGILKRKTWEGLPAAGFSICVGTAFPIGTVIAYYSLTALWKCRESFFPFKGRQAEPPPPLTR